MEKGTINVQTENIFPIIKKFLYSDHEIFLRELVSNAMDATEKVKKLAILGDVKQELGDLTISVSIDKEAKTLTIEDKGIGMTAEEVNKYINQIAFSSAEEFLEKFKKVEDKTTIIGHFGLGFYSAFMVASKVEIFTKSYKDEPAAHWTCTGSPEYTLEETDKQDRGTKIVLHINEDSEEFLEEPRIMELLNRYCKFLPIPIQFGEQTFTEKDDKGEEVNKTKPRIINNTSPAWIKSPSDLKDEDYLAFYRELYPMAEDPLFWIHLNVDYPFNLTGILYFPKFKKSYEVQKNKIQLYQNQVFVTDNVEEIVPEYLTLLHGVLDSPDIPLNVSRSYLQADSNVKKITSHISKKVADKLHELFKDDREGFEKKWESTGLFVKYGMISDDKFYDRVKDFCLYKSVDGKYFTLEEYKEKIKPNQTDKNDRLVLLYTTDPDSQHTYLESAKDKGYDVLEFDSIIDQHFVSAIEQKLENLEFKRVDADTPDKLIEKDEKHEELLSEEEREKLKQCFEEVIADDKVNVEVKSLSPTDLPIVIVQNELMRRMKEMQQMGGGFMGEFPMNIQLVVNANHPVASKILRSKGKKKQLIGQLYDLALLSQGMLSGAKLTEFIKRSVDVMKD
jgi:molecular chaperone HtpG